MVIWIVGLAAAGKSTLCAALQSILKPHLPSIAVVEGEEIRKAFGHDLGYGENDRVIGGKRLQGMAHVLSAQGIPAIVACIYCRQDLLDWNRQNLPDYFEIYLKASMSTVFARDPKNIYKRARAGGMPDVVGMDLPFPEPQRPDVVFDCDRPEPPDIWARAIVRQHSGLHRRLRPAALGEFGLEDVVLRMQPASKRK